MFDLIEKWIPNHYIIKNALIKDIHHIQQEIIAFNEQEMTQTTLQQPNNVKMKCRNGDACWYLKQGRCWFHHESISTKNCNTIANIDTNKQKKHSKSHASKKCNTIANTNTNVNANTNAKTNATNANANKNTNANNNFSNDKNKKKRKKKKKPKRNKAAVNIDRKKKKKKYRRARRKKKKQSIDLILQNMKFSARSESSPEPQVKESNPIAKESGRFRDE